MIDENEPAMPISINREGDILHVGGFTKREILLKDFMCAHLISHPNDTIKGVADCGQALTDAYIEQLNSGGSK